MKLGNLVEEILEIVQDPSIDAKKVKRIINDGILEAVSLSDTPLPDLETSAEVKTKTDRAWVNLPDDYHRKLNFCYSAAQNDRVATLDSLQQLQSKYPDLTQSGVIWYVAISGGRLYYQGIPDTVDTLRIGYYKLPPTIARDDEEPAFLPRHLHKKLLVNYACKEFFNIIEDGVEGRKVNTASYEGKWEKALVDLEMFLGPEQDEPKQINDMIMEIMQ